MLPDIKFRNIIYFFVIGIFIQSCTLYEHPTVVDAELPGDKELTCAELKNSFAEASRYVQEAENTKGVTSDRAKRTLLLPFLMSGNIKMQMKQFMLQI